MVVEKGKVNPCSSNEWSVQGDMPTLGLYDTQWEDNFALYKAFKTEYGREPLVTESYHGCRLGAWCNTQRVYYKTGRLYVDRLEKLVSAGFVFELYEKAWQDNFHVYIAFKAEHGREPSFSGGPDEKNLARWCTVQRRAHKNSTLIVERAQMLLEAGFVFRKRETQWKENVELYVAYKNEFGREPKVNDVYRGANIGSWCKVQRNLYRSDRLSGERVQRLLDVGFDFERKRAFSGSLDEKLSDASERSGATPRESGKRREIGNGIDR